jgi:hypothetical protein
MFAGEIEQLTAPAESCILTRGSEFELQLAVAFINSLKAEL